ncbi:MAG: hypothetical protein QM737_08005 [Ferruginibacter sp.]
MKIFWLTKNDFFPRRLYPFLKEQDIVLSAICTDPSQAMLAYLQSGADVIVMDFSWYSNMVSGVALIRDFLSLDDSIKIIVSTSYYQSEVDNRYKLLGAVGYFHKNDTPENIIRSLRMESEVAAVC